MTANACGVKSGVSVSGARYTCEKPAGHPDKHARKQTLVLQAVWGAPGEPPITEYAGSVNGGGGSPRKNPYTAYGAGATSNKYNWDYIYDITRTNNTANSPVADDYLRRTTEAVAEAEKKTARAEAEAKDAQLRAEEVQAANAKDVRVLVEEREKFQTALDELVEGLANTHKPLYGQDSKNNPLVWCGVCDTVWPCQTKRLIEKASDVWDR